MFFFKERLNTTEEKEPENEKMKILLSFYPDYKIRQLSDHTATFWLSNDYDLFIDTNTNPGSWTAQRKRGNMRYDMMLRGGRVPKEDVEKADALITRYQGALVSHVMEVEENEKEGIKKDIEVLKWHKKHRGQDSTIPLTSHHREENIKNEMMTPEHQEKFKKYYLGDFKRDRPEEPNLEEIQEAPADPEEVQAPHFPTAEEFAEGLNNSIGNWVTQINKAIEPAIPEEPNLDEIQEAPADPEEVQAQPKPEELIKTITYGARQGRYQEFKSREEAAEKLKAIKKDLPEEPNLEEIQEAPADPEGEEKANKTPYRHPLGPGYYALPCHPLDPDFKNLVSSKAAADLHTWDEKDQALEEKIQEIRNKEPEAAQDLKTRLTEKIINSMEAGKLQPGESYKEKIEVKIKEIIQALETEMYIIQSGESEKDKDPEREKRISKIMENFEVLKLLQDCQARQTLRSQEPEEGKHEPDEGKQEPKLNELYINKNGKGYSWRITARAADMEEAIKWALIADEICKTNLNPQSSQNSQNLKGAGDNES